jgi:threonine dehydratase
MQNPKLSVPRIEEAMSVMDPVFRNTPQISCDPLSREAGADIVLKVETLNPIRSFKGRGTDYFVHCLEDRTPLVTASAGNFGQGLAYAARKRGLGLEVFAAENANPLKVDRMRDLGAKVTLTGSDFDAAKAAAREYAERTERRLVEDGREAAISEGAGTIGLELLRLEKTLDAIVVPVGNGAMINGIGTWVKAHLPGTRIIGVCAAGAPAMERSWRSSQVMVTAEANTIADGIAVRVPVPVAVEHMKDTVDDVLLIDDATTLQAMRLLLHHTGLLVEPAGAIGVAAIIAHREQFAGRYVATPLCGSNVTPQQFREWFLA